MRFSIRTVFLLIAVAAIAIGGLLQPSHAVLYLIDLIAFSVGTIGTMSAVILRGRDQAIAVGCALPIWTYSYFFPTKTFSYFVLVDLFHGDLPGIFSNLESADPANLRVIVFERILMLLFSFVGSCLGLWLYKRRTPK
jgi:hypothetical protein